MAGLIPDIGFWHMAPVIVPLLAPILILLIDAIAPRRGTWLPMLLTIAGLVLTAALLVAIADERVALALAGKKIATAFNGFLRYDLIGRWGAVICIVAGVLIALISPRTIRLYELPPAEYYALLNFAVYGMIVLCLALEMLTIFLAIEITAVSFYVMLGLQRNSLRSSEAALKYFILSSFSTAFLLFGFAFLYAAAGGSTMLGDLAPALLSAQRPPWLTLGFALALAGLAFKLTLVPFHLYAADVFEGAPTPVAALLATGSKVAAFIAAVHILVPLRLIPPVEEILPTGPTEALRIASLSMLVAEILAILSALSIVAGNLVAILQRNIKRMLAYSSIAHSGYILIAVVVLIGAQSDYRQIEYATLIYLFAYVIMSVAAFGVALTLGERGERNIEDYAGLSLRSPGLALAMTVAMLSLTGIPTTAGFIGKFYIFRAGVQSGFTWLVVVGVLGSAVSAYYYLRVVVFMYMREPISEMPAERVGWTQSLGLFLAAASIMVFGIVPQVLLALLTGGF
jgi:NADH-quinone oxidoreductase subunit N